MKKLIVSLFDSLHIVLVAPTKKLPELMRSGIGLEPYSMVGLSLVASIIILYFTRSVERTFIGLEMFSMKAFLVGLVVCAWWNLGSITWMVIRETWLMYNYYGKVQSYIDEYVSEGEEVPQYYLDDLKRIS